MSLPALLDQRLRLPMVAAPMFLVSNPQLVLACCRSGIVGSFRRSTSARAAASRVGWRKSGPACKRWTIPRPMR